MAHEKLWPRVAEKFAPGHKTTTSEHELNDFEKLFLGATTAFHRLFSNVASLQISTQIFDNLESFSKQTHDDWAFYRQSAFFEDNNKFFKPVENHEFSIRDLPAESAFADAKIEEISFKSKFKPVSPFYRAEFLQQDHKVAIAKHIRHKEGARPTLICLHGMSNENFEINSFILQIPEIYRAGFNILYVTLPFHGARKLANARLSGDGFLTLNVTTINEHMAYAIHDLRVFLNFLNKHTITPEIGIISYSLGAYISALLTSVDRRLDFSVNLMPVTSTLDALLTWQPLNKALHMAMNLAGLDANEVRQSLAIHSPLSHRPLLSKDKLFLAGAKNDAITVGQHANLLWQHWGQPEMYWDKGNHLIQFNRDGLISAISDFLYRRVLYKY